MVFVSQNYLEKVGGVNGPQDQCKKEFEYAERTKGADKLSQSADPNPETNPNPNPNPTPTPNPNPTPDPEQVRTSSSRW